MYGFACPPGPDGWSSRSASSSGPKQWTPGPSGVYAISAALHPHFASNDRSVSTPSELQLPGSRIEKDPRAGGEHGTLGQDLVSHADDQFSETDNNHASCDSDGKLQFPKENLDESSQQRQLVTLSSPSLLPRYTMALDRKAYYIDYLGSNCLSALPPIFKRLAPLSIHHPALEDAMIALAACNLSRNSPEMTLSGCTNEDLTYRPNPDHWASSQSHYLSALTTSRRSVATGKGIEPQIMLAILVLFSCLELSIGNHPGFHSLSQGIAQFVEKVMMRADNVASSIDLLAAWVQSRAQDWWMRQYFSTFTFQLAQPSMSAPAFLEEHTSSSDSVRRAIILSILCESHRLHQKLLLNTFPPLQTSDPTNTVMPPTTTPTTQWYRTSMYQELLTLQAQRTLQWSRALPSSALPLNPDSPAPSYLFPSGLSITPLHFTSHTHAMNYAYFISARLMQHAPFDLSGEHITDSDDLVLLLLRITAGLSPSSCLSKNTYSIGISSLLLSALLHTCSLDIGEWIESFLLKFRTANGGAALEEGSFPLAQVRRVVSVINEQRRGGRNVFAVSQLEEEGEQEERRSKAESYQCQDIRVVLLHGRVRATGELFQESVVFD